MTRQIKIIVIAALALIPLLTLIPSLVDATPVYTTTEFFPTDDAKVRLDVEYGQEDSIWKYCFTFTNLPGSEANLGLISIDFGRYEDGTDAAAPTFYWSAGNESRGSIMNMGDAIWVMPNPTLGVEEVLPAFYFEYTEYVAETDVLLSGKAPSQEVQFPRPTTRSVPEPGSLLLLGSAILILAGIFRKMSNLIR